MKQPQIYNIDSLSEISGLSRRTIHYYSQRGLLMPPLGEGRGSCYNEEHVKRLEDLKKWTGLNIPLAQIKLWLENGESYPAYAQTETIGPPPNSLSEQWERFSIAEGVELHVRQGAISAEQIRDLINKFNSER